MKSLLLMVTFFTRIPISSPHEFDEKDFVKGIKFIPLIGLIIGLFLFVISFINNYIDKSVTSLIIFICYLWITGGLHIDGLADTADGIFSYREKDKILEIMKDSRIGTFGVIFIVIHFVSSIILISYIDFKYLIILPVIGRSCGILSAALSNYPRENGFGKSFIQNSGKVEGFLSILFPLIITFIAYRIDFTVIVSILITFVISIIICKKIKNKIDGLTGDNIGFIIELSQIIFLFNIYILSQVIQ